MKRWCHMNDGLCRGALWAALAASAILACRPKPAAGGSCRVPDQLVCSPGGGALVCDSAEWVAVPCKGPRGCVRRGDADDCDDTIAAEGDRCPHTPPLDYACTADRTRALTCERGTFATWRQCRGADGCQVVDGRNIHCDTSVGEPGDRCAQKGAYACSVDSRAMLVCDGSVLATASSCRGPEGCRTQRETHKVDCDDSVASEGDACDQPKRIACSVDHKAELVCAAGKFATKRECRHTECHLEGNELFCD
jgi:Carbohydrate binding domain (family 19)